MKLHNNEGVAKKFRRRRRRRLPSMRMMVRYATTTIHCLRCCCVSATHGISGFLGPVRLLFGSHIISNLLLRLGLFLLQLVMLLLCLAVATNTVIVLARKQPPAVKNIHVHFRDTVTVIPDGCSTAQELADRFRQLSGRTDLNKIQVLCQKKALQPNDSLAEAGIQPGDKVILVPHDKQVTGVDILAVYLFMASNGAGTFSQFKGKMTGEQSEQFEQFEELWKEAKDKIVHLTRQDVADGLRNGFDLAYHRLRSLWEHPVIRQNLHDPDRIETYRKVVLTSVSPQMLKEWKLEKAVRSKDDWRQTFLKYTSQILRIGDIIMDGILDVLLEVLKGKGASAKYASSSTSSEYGQEYSSSSANLPETNPRMDDPSLANDLLYELSESDED